MIIIVFFSRILDLFEEIILCDNWTNSTILLCTLNVQNIRYSNSYLLIGAKKCLKYLRYEIWILPIFTIEFQFFFDLLSDKLIESDIFLE